MNSALHLREQAYRFPYSVASTPPQPHALPSTSPRRRLQLDYGMS